MIWLFPKTRSMLALFEAIAFLATAAYIKEGHAWYIAIPAWLFVSALVYLAVSAAALNLHNRFLALLFSAQQPGEFVRLYAPATEAKHLRRNVRFTMKSYLACAYEAMGKYDKALSVLGAMPEQKGARQRQAQAIVAAQRCGVYLSMGKTDKAKQEYQALQTAGSSAVKEQTMELLRIRIALAEEKSTKERILEEALRLFAKNGYLGTSMNDIARQLGVTKAALYKHYTSKQEILDSIVNRMDSLDYERGKKYEMPQGDSETVITGYREADIDKIKQITKVQFLHWTEEGFPNCFRKMLMLEQYRDETMAALFQKYLVSRPVSYMETIFHGLTGKKSDARQLALIFYGPIFLMYSLYDAADEKEEVIKMLELHVERFSKML